MKIFKKIGITLGICLLIAVPLFHKSTKSAPVNDYPTVWVELPPGAILDSWGNGTKDCTSWVAWRAWQDFRYKTDQWGQAKDWPAKAKQSGLAVDTVATVNSAMVNTNFSPGHIMWVKAINTDGTVRVSEYNNGGHGTYDERDVATYAMVFIHFPKIDRGY